MAFVCNNLISQIWIQYSHLSASTIITNWHLTNTDSSHAKQVLEQHQLAVPVAWKENMMQIVAKRYRISPGTYCHALTNIPLSILICDHLVFSFFSVHAAIFFYSFFFCKRYTAIASKLNFSIFFKFLSSWHHMGIRRCKYFNKLFNCANAYVRMYITIIAHNDIYQKNIQRTINIWVNSSGKYVNLTNQRMIFFWERRP
mgnify:CR=1 FL=1